MRGDCMGRRRRRGSGRPSVVWPRGATRWRNLAGRPRRTGPGRAARPNVRTTGGQVFQALDAVIGADQGTSPGFGATADTSRDGRGGMDRLVGATRAGVAALAPSTDTPAR